MIEDIISNSLLNTKRSTVAVLSCHAAQWSSFQIV